MRGSQNEVPLGKASSRIFFQEVFLTKLNVSEENPAYCGFLQAYISSYYLSVLHPFPAEQVAQAGFLAALKPGVNLLCFLDLELLRSR